MRTLLQVVFFILALSTGCLQPLAAETPAGPAAVSSVPAAGEVQLPVTQVVLFTSGVGYFEHSGTIDGNGSTRLDFKTGQINDVLKSLVLEDLDGGRIGTVVYPSRDPVEKILQSFQVDLAPNPSLAEFLNQLRGAPVRVTALADPVEGSVLGVEKRPKAVVGPDGQVVEEWVLNVLSDGTVRSVRFEDIRGLDLKDSQLEEELHKALLALSEARSRDRKPVTIHFEGHGPRRVRLRYVVEAPIWKASYRLILPDAPEEGAKLQGWAIVENQTDTDWENVRLSLVSGRPISFVEDLYSPIYIDRPVVRPELYSSLKPRTYGPGMELKAERAQMDEFGSEAEDQAVAAPPPARAKARGMTGAVPDREAFDPTAGVIAAAAPERLGELFQYTIGDVSLPRYRSAMLPILTDSIAAERVSIYNPEVLPLNPLQGVLLKNTAGKPLMGGPVTVLYNGTYAGDAQIGNLPPGQSRLLSYAIDLDMHVDSSRNRQESTIQTARILRGVLELARKQSFSQEYSVENKSDREKILVIEHRFRPGWKLAAPSPFETTESHYRFRETIAPGKSAKIRVVEETTRDESVAILPATVDTIQIYSRSGEIPEDVREVLRKAVALKQAMAEAERGMEEKRREIEEIAREQERIRSNIAAVDPKSQYHARLIEKLSAQETAIEEIRGAIEQLQQTFEARRKELEDTLMKANAG